MEFRGTKTYCRSRKPYRLIPGFTQSYQYISRAGSMQIASEVPLIGDDIAGPQQTPPVIIPSKTRNGPRWTELGLFQADLSPISSACFMTRCCAVLLDSLPLTRICVSSRHLRDLFYLIL